MPHQEPPGPQGPSVRRAVPLSGSASTPDPASLLPKGRKGGERGTPDEPVSRPAPAGGTTGADPESAKPETPQAPTTPEAPKTSASSKKPEPVTARTTVIPAVATSSAAGSDAAKGARAEGGAGAGAEGLTATGVGLPPEARTATDTGGGEPPSGRPTKALLAAAAIGGVLLIAVPLLVFAADDGDKKDKTTPTAAGVTIPDKEEAKGPGLYSAKSPSPSPSPSKEKEEKSTAGKESVAGAPVKEAPVHSADPGKTEKAEEAKETTKKTAAKPLVATDISYSQNKVLRNGKTGMCADLPASGKGKVGGPVNQDHCETTSKDNQLWSFDVKLKGGGPSGSNLFVIRNTKDSLCMDLPGKGVVNGSTGLIEGMCDGGKGDNQLWWLESRGSGTYWIHNYANDSKCLEIWGSAGGGGWVDSRLDLASCSTKDDHEWRVG